MIEFESIEPDEVPSWYTKVKRGCLVERNIINSQTGMEKNITEFMDIMRKKQKLHGMNASRTEV